MANWALNLPTSLSSKSLAACKKTTGNLLLWCIWQMPAPLKKMKRRAVSCIFIWMLYRDLWWVFFCTVYDFKEQTDVTVWRFLTFCQERLWYWQHWGPQYLDTELVRGCFGAGKGQTFPFWKPKSEHGGKWYIWYIIHVQIYLDHVVQLLPHIYVCNFCLYRYILISFCGKRSWFTHWRGQLPWRPTSWIWKTPIAGIWQKERCKKTGTVRKDPLNCQCLDISFETIWEKTHVSRIHMCPG